MERASLFVGGRGTGKTVMLNEVEHLAREYGWHVVAETATPGLLDRLVPSDALLSTANELADRICHLPPAAVRVTNRAIQAGLEASDIDVELAR